MNDTKHTPGPWKFLESFGRVETDQHVIAYIAGGLGSPHFNLDHAKANGQLIAAAPELLEALKALLPHLPDRNDALNYAAINDGKVLNVHVAVQRAYDALRKAKGESHPALP